MSFLTLRGTLTLNQKTAHAVFYQGAWYERSGEGYWPHGVIWARCDGAPHPDRSCLQSSARHAFEGYCLPVR